MTTRTQNARRVIRHTNHTLLDFKYFHRGKVDIGDHFDATRAYHIKGFASRRTQTQIFRGNLIEIAFPANVAGKLAIQRIIVGVLVDGAFVIRVTEETDAQFGSFFHTLQGDLGAVVSWLHCFVIFWFCVFVLCFVIFKHTIFILFFLKRDYLFFVFKFNLSFVW